MEWRAWSRHPLSPEVGGTPWPSGFSPHAWSLQSHAAMPTTGATMPTTGATMPTTGAAMPTTGAAMPTTGATMPTTGAAMPTTGAPGTRHSWPSGSRVGGSLGSGWTEPLAVTAPSPAPEEVVVGHGFGSNGRVLNHDARLHAWLFSSTVAVRAFGLGWEDFWMRCLGLGAGRLQLSRACSAA